MRKIRNFLKERRVHIREFPVSVKKLLKKLKIQILTKIVQSERKNLSIQVLLQQKF